MSVMNESALRRVLPISVVSALMAFALSGCLLNTPTNVVKRFVGTIKRVQWDRMEKLIDWASSEQALQKRFGQDRKAVLTAVAEGISGYQISYYGEKRARSNFSFFRVREVKYIEKTADTARLNVTIKLTNATSKTIEMTVKKVGRTWRIVLTPNLLEREPVHYSGHRTHTEKGELES